MMRIATLVVGSFVLGALVAPVGLEGQVRPWEISIAGGPSFPTGDLSDEANTGFHVQGSVGFGLPLLPFGARFDALWQEVPDVHDGWFRQIGVLGNAVVAVPLVFVQPYGLLGVGLLRTETPEEDHGDHAHEGETESFVGFNAGLGLEFPFAGLTGFLEARYLNLFGSGEATHFRTIPVSVGIRF
jgi:hypothetical protein